MEVMISVKCKLWSLNSVPPGQIEALRVPQSISEVITTYFNLCRRNDHNVDLQSRQENRLFFVSMATGKKMLTFCILCFSKFECPKVAIRSEMRAEMFCEEHKW